MAHKDLVIKADYPIEQKNVVLISCIAQEIAAEMNRKLQPFGISSLQLSMLHALSKSPEGKLTVNQIKAVLVEESPNVSRALNKLMDRDLIRKERDSEDQRVVHILLTEEGRRMHSDADLRLAGKGLPLTEEENRQLYQLLIKI